MLGYIMTVPAYMLDALGLACYKGESFVNARHYLTDQSWCTIEKASTIRKMWQEEEGVNYTLNAIPKWIPPILGSNYFEQWDALFNEVISLIDDNGEGSRS